MSDVEVWGDVYENDPKSPHFIRNFYCDADDISFDKDGVCTQNQDCRDEMLAMADGYGCTLYNCKKVRLSEGKPEDER